MPIWAAVLIGVGGAFVAGGAVYVGWMYWAYKQFNDIDI